MLVCVCVRERGGGEGECMSTQRAWGEGGEWAVSLDV